MKSRSFRLLALFGAGFFVCLILAPVRPVFATWEITTDTTWKLSDSPIVATEWVAVRAGAKLTIEPGVVVKFAAPDPYDRSMFVQGQLDASGTSDQPIIFTTIEDDVGGDTNGDGTATSPVSGAWWKIAFQNTTGNKLSNVIIRYGGTSETDVLENYRSQLTITDSTFTKNIGTIVNNEGELTISNSSIFDNLMFSSGKYMQTGINSQGVVTVNATNNWWGTVDGPCAWQTLVPPETPRWMINFYELCGTKPLVDDNVVYSPWLTQAPGVEVVKKINPVIVIPGIMGSWQDWQGVWQIDPILHTYDDLLDALRLAGYKDGETLFAFPYQWRQSNVISAGQLRDKVQAVKAACKGDDKIDCSKVDLIGHSMGGLVARAYIEGDDYQKDVDQMIFIATPHRGAPKAYLMWEGGEMEPKPEEKPSELLLKFEALENGYSGDGALSRYIKERQIYSVRELLPNYSYLFDKDDNYTKIRNYPNNYPINQFLDTLNSPENSAKLKGIKITNILGNIDAATLNALYLTTSIKANLWENGMPYDFYSNSQDGLFYGDGDGTVPSISNGNFLANGNILINKDHRLVVSYSQKAVIKELLGKEPETEVHNFNIPNILLLAMHSPADFVVTAPDGKKIGRDFSGKNTINEITNAFYSGYNISGIAEFVVIPNPISGEYKVTAQGTGLGGAYSVSADYINESTSSSILYSGQIMAGQSRNITFNYSSDDNTFKSVLVDITMDSAIKDVGDIYGRGLLIGQNNKQKVIQQYELLKLKIRVADQLINLANTGLNKLKTNSSLKGSVKNKLIELANKEIEKLKQAKSKMIVDSFNDLNKYLDKLVVNGLLKSLGYDIIKLNNEYLMNNLK